MSSISSLGSFYYLLLVAAAFFTAYYSGRLIIMVFLSEPRGSRASYEAAHEPGKHMTRPLFMLMISTIFFGYYHRDLFVGSGTDFWRGTLCFSDSFVNNALLAEATLGVFQKNLPLFLSFAGILLSYVVFGLKVDLYNPFYVYGSKFLAKKWYFDSIYNNFLSFPAYRLFYEVPFKAVDKGFLELFGPHGLVKSVDFSSKLARSLATGYIFDYLAYTVLAFGFLLIFTLYGAELFLEDFFELFLIIFPALLAFPLILTPAPSDLSAKHV